jgi:hypothetical protein
MKFTTPILFLIFNRPDPAKQVFEEIRKIKPLRLFIACDGPRNNNLAESKKVNELRHYLLSNVDWPCDVKTLFRNENLGCGKAVSSAITWFFEQVDEGIILEDDCLPHSDFFPYCTELLNKYRNIENVKFIGGSNFQDGKKIGNSSYYFSAYSHVWGWASWRRVWKEYDFTLNHISWENLHSSLVRYGFVKDEMNRWKHVYEKMKLNLIDTWDYQLLFSIWNTLGVCIIPNENLVSNIGFGQDSTHTNETITSLSNIQTKAIYPITHPDDILISRYADGRYFNRKVKMSLLRMIKIKLSKYLTL